MQLIGRSIKDPVSVIVGVLLIALFGLLALFRFPIQLTPNVDLPVIIVSTTWADASPQEVEREIVKRQEEKLKNTRGLKKMVSTSQRSSASVTLEFELGTDIDRARLDVSDMLRQVEDYPDDVDEPVVKSGAQAEAAKIAWLILGAERDGLYVPHHKEFVDDLVVPKLRRVPGVADVAVYGGQERQVQIRVDMPALAARKLSLDNLADALRRENINASAGDLTEGKAAYQIRVRGQFERLEEVQEVVIAQQPGGPVYVRDVAEVAFGYREPPAHIRHKGNTVMAFGVSREVGANVIEVMAGIRQAVDELNERILTAEGLHLEQVYDETDYIYSAIGLVRSNMLIGAVLAAVVMLVYLRAGRPTLVVAACIPISVIGTFLALSLMGRNLNVISLAGMAFAVGMVVDNAIVVLENIYRHRQLGEGVFESAYQGTVEVWGAVLASTLTTVAVFLPVLFVQQEAGQLFRDIALAISSGVAISLVVSITVIPMLSARLLAGAGESGLRTNRALNVFTGVGERISRAILVLLQRILASVRVRVATIVALIVTAIGGSWLLMPPASYLPTGDQNLIFAFLILPAGYSVEEAMDIGAQVEETIRPFWQAKHGTAEADALPFPPVENFFYVGFGGMSFMGLTAQQPEQVKQLENLATTACATVPGVFPFAQQKSIFTRAVGSSGNAIDVEISGYDIGQVTVAGAQLFAALMADSTIGGPGSVRPDPTNFMLGGPEVQLRPDRVKLARAGVRWDTVALAMRTVIDGAIVGDFYDQGKKIDLVLTGPAGTALAHTQDVRQVPIYAPRAGVVPVSNLVRYVSTTAQEQINHIEELPAVRLTLRIPKGLALEQVMTIIRTDIIAPLRNQGAIGPDVNVALAGTASKLVETAQALAGGFVLALIITYLLMSALLGSFVHPLIIMLSVPLAFVGGFAGLRMVHAVTGQQMDVLTMLGFVILIGTVVNNAILIVYQALNNIRAGSDMNDAIMASVRTRLRPIFMSATTTIFGMMPLVVMGGSGSELYRGLGAVIVGGLAVSTIFTVFLIPAILSFVPIRLIAKRQ